jgi:4-carboxymuconolactone decarboxylase
MDKATYDRGLEIRKSVLGNEFVDKAIASADDFNRPMQDPQSGDALRAQPAS